MATFGCQAELCWGLGLITKVSSSGSRTWSEPGLPYRTQKCNGSVGLGSTRPLEWNKELQKFMESSGVPLALAGIEYMELSGVPMALAGVE